jgi:NAD(P)-dependent dehydrogenase (short-subunit alcohol dehydrogenase family)
MVNIGLEDVPKYAELWKLDGKRFVVLGSGRGIGRQCAHALAAAGGRVLCTDIDIEMAKSVAGEVGGLSWSGDLSRRDQTEALFEFASENLGGVDGLVDIIGLTRAADLVDYDDAAWDRQFDMVLRPALLAMQVGSRYIKRSGGGSMAFVGSVSGIYGAPWHSAYGSAKAALMHLVKSAAVEFAPENIRVNAVSPGRIATPLILESMDEQMESEFAESIPQRRLGRPSDIAAALLFLMCPMSSYITGQTILVDGGVGAANPYVQSRDVLMAPPAGE